MHDRPGREQTCFRRFSLDTIRQKLAADQIVKGGAIEVIVKDGAVTLKGTVEEDKQKNKAEKIAKKVSGVKSVANEIKIAASELIAGYRECRISPTTSPKRVAANLQIRRRARMVAIRISRRRRTSGSARFSNSMPTRIRIRWSCVTTMAALPDSRTICRVVCISANRKRAASPAWIQKGKTETLAEGYQGRKFNAPNDIVVRRDGHICFTDPAFGSANDHRELDFYGIWHISPEGRSGSCREVADAGPTALPYRPMASCST